MKLKKLYAVILLVSLLVPAYGEAKTTKVTKPEVSESINDAVVNLYCRIKVGKKTYSSSGSGVFISDRGVILTNAHVAQYFVLLEKEKVLVKGWCSVRTGSPADEHYTASVLYFPPAWLEENASQINKKQQRGTGENDFALLYVTGAEKGNVLPAKFPSIPFDTALNLTGDRDVAITGYPTENLDFSKTRNRLLQITAKSSIESTLSFNKSKLKDVLTIAPSDAGSSGVSGGPIVQQATDKVIGIVTNKSSAKEKASLRAITIAYISRTIESQIGIPLSSLLAGDFAARALITNTNLPHESIQTLIKGFRNKR